MTSLKKVASKELGAAPHPSLDHFRLDGPLRIHVLSLNGVLKITQHFVPALIRAKPRLFVLVDHQVGAYGNKLQSIKDLAKALRICRLSRLSLDHDGARGARPISRQSEIVSAPRGGLTHGRGHSHLCRTPQERPTVLTALSGPPIRLMLRKSPEDLVSLVGSRRTTAAEVSRGQKKRPLCRELQLCLSNNHLKRTQALIGQRRTTVL